MKTGVREDAELLHVVGLVALGIELRGLVELVEARAEVLAVAPTGAAASTSGPALGVVLVARLPEQDVIAEATAHAAMARAASFGTGIDPGSSSPHGEQPFTWVVLPDSAGVRMLRMLRPAR
jgi:hypothetical protein